MNRNYWRAAQCVRAVRSQEMWEVRHHALAARLGLALRRASLRTRADGAWACVRPQSMARMSVKSGRLEVAEASSPRIPCGVPRLLGVQQNSL